MRKLSAPVMLAVILLAPATGIPSDTPITRDIPGLQAFVHDVSERHALEPERVERVLADAQHQQDIIDAITSPAEALPWHRYRSIFLQEDRIRDGVSFWDENEELLSRVADEYGVDPAILVAIIGVETRYGEHSGRHRVLDALFTLAFDYPPRADFFRSELEHFLLLTEEEGLDPFEIRGSYAGAMGMPQFIASSYRHYAVDGSGDGRRDLMNDVADAVASVGNYFSEHGWRAGAPVVAPANVADDADTHAFTGDGIRLTTTVGELREAGIDPEAEFRDDAQALFLELDGASGAEHWVGLRNFYVITRYNHSPLYALAAFQLAEAIRDEWEAR
ncbi:lytic murein transglycosylase B [Aquisalimonas sp.]|uniref:lytic murein transglycosylase B n=1 Tax=Aquisalimonas sp. TaxID=1872621 RepID=UPI0025B95213|nr:lytic murein transglycosylase B [Aquisalimonas sp.]